MSHSVPIPNPCDVSGGGRCIPGGFSGCCTLCGVPNDLVCPTCRGKGYHFNGCADGDVDIEEVIDRPLVLRGR